MSDILDAATQQQTPASQGGDQLATKLAGITNENGEPKYASVEVALDALKNSQEYIPTLKNEVAQKDAEIATMRQQIAEAQGASKAQEELVRLMQQTTQQPAQPGQTVATTTETQEQTVDVNSLVQAAFAAHQKETLKESNANEVNSVLATQYGDKAVEHITNKARELNTTPEAIKEMAKTNPTMTLALLGVEKPKASMSYGGANTAAWPAPKTPKLEPPKQSLLAGAKRGEVESFMKAIQAEIYNEHGINA